MTTPIERHLTEAAVTARNLNTEFFKAPAEDPRPNTHTFKGVKVLTPEEVRNLSEEEGKTLIHKLYALSAADYEDYKGRMAIRAAVHQAYEDSLVEPEPEFLSDEDAEAYRELNTPKYTGAQVDRFIGAAYNLLYKPLTKGASMEPWYMALWGEYCKAVREIMNEDE